MVFEFGIVANDLSGSLDTGQDVSYHLRGPVALVPSFKVFKIW